MNWQAKVYYCGWIPKGTVFTLSDNEIAEGLMWWNKKTDPVFWITRPQSEIHSIEDPHSFGVVMAKKEALKAYKQLDILNFRKNFYNLK